MRRALLFLTFLTLWALGLGAQQQPVFPRHAAAPRTCDGNARGFAYHNTTDGKPYECTASGWVDLTASTTVDTAAVEAALPVSDATELVKGSATSSKRARIEVDGLSVGVTRVINMPDADTTLPVATQVLTFTGPTAARSFALPDTNATVAALGVAQTWGSTQKYPDDVFQVVGSADATKILRYEVDGQTTGTTRTITTPNADTILPVFGQVITFAGPTAARTVTLPDAAFTVAGLGTANAFTSTNSFVDGSLSVVGSADATKIAQFEVDGFTTGNTRVFTIPGTTGNDTFLMLGGAQTVSGNKTFSATNTVWNDGVNIALGSSTDAVISYRTTNTPDTLSVGVSADSNTLLIREQADSANDSGSGAAGTASATHPQMCIMSATGATQGDYSCHNYAGVAGKAVKTLTESSATATIEVTVAAEAGTSGTYLVSVYATDGSTPQVRHLRVQFAATNDGGTTTCTLGTPEEIDHTPTGTLTATITCVDGTAALQLQVNAVSSLTQTTLEAYSQVIVAGPGQIIPQ
jgi:hypothetical protein